MNLVEIPNIELSKFKKINETDKYISYIYPIKTGDIIQESCLPVWKYKKSGRPLNTNKFIMAVKTEKRESENMDRVIITLIPTWTTETAYPVVITNERLNVGLMSVHIQSNQIVYGSIKTNKGVHLQRIEY